MVKLSNNKKVILSNGRVRWEKVETDYLPVAPRIAWFRRDHPDWSIITKTIRLAHKAVVMKAIIKDSTGRIIATARKKETEIGFPDIIEKAEMGADGRALTICGYDTLQTPVFDEGHLIGMLDRLIMRKFNKITASLHRRILAACLLVEML